jgi:hypothetical protein
MSGRLPSASAIHTTPTVAMELRLLSGIRAG